MYKLKIGEISRECNRDWFISSMEVDEMLEPVLIEKDCTMAALPLAAKTFRDEVQLDWGTFAWKAFKSELRKFFRKKGIPEKELEAFDEYKEYGVVYIDN